jgi:hypothetical protein
MPSAVPLAPVRPPRRARYLIPLGTPRRSELLAAMAVAAVVAGVLFAPLTLLLAVAFDAVSKATRWRPIWLAVPAASGVLWVLAIGRSAAAAGLRRGPAAAVDALAANPAASRLPAAITHALPGQFPLALILAAGLATVAWWVRWLHTDAWDVPATRPGLVSIWHRRQAAASLRAGRVLTRDGVRLGVEAATGRAAVLCWRDAGGGVLVTGAAPATVLASGLRLADAAIQRRKPVIVVDLTGDRDLPGALAAHCGAARAPLHVFGGTGGPRYEPGMPAGAAQRAALAAVPWGHTGGGPGTSTGASLAGVVRQRGVALFTLDGPGYGPAAGVIAGLIAADVAALYATMYRTGIAPDGVCWLTECAGVDPAAVAGLVAAGSPAGLAPVLATTAPEPAARIAGEVNAAVVHRLADPALAAAVAPLTGTTIVPIGQALAPPEPAGTGDDGPVAGGAGHAIPLGTMEVPVVQAATLCALRSGDFVLMTGLAAARAGGAAVAVRAPCHTVSGPLPARPGPGGLPDPWGPR